MSLAIPNPAYEACCKFLVVGYKFYGNTIIPIVDETRTATQEAVAESWRLFEERKAEQDPYKTIHVGPPPTTQPKFKLGDHVYKPKGSSWYGRVVGTYSTELTSEGYCVESEYHPGSVQIYPAAALEFIIKVTD